MDHIPEWLNELLSSPGPQVPEMQGGLYLTLKLAEPAKLPMMLFDVLAAQAQIKAALQDLSFLHFARFIPSWDGSALMVVTEFDGPLKPYVLDFAIAIGDVFDKLLSYVDNPPPLPVRDHPEAFWAFVEKWNRVPFAPRTGGNTAVTLPPGFEYPMFKAYPDKSTIDISGARDPRVQPLLPTLDRAAARVDRADVQGNILQGYNAKSACHLCLEVTDAGKARTWLQDHLAPRLTTAAPWPDGPKPDSLLNLALTHAGLQALLPALLLADLPPHARFPQAFVDGAAKRAGNDEEPGNGDVGASAPAHWRFGRDEQRIHVVLSVHAFARRGELGHAAFLAAVDALQAEAEAHGLAQVGERQFAHARPDDRLYFNLVDGLTTPRIAGQCPGDQPDWQPAASVGEFLLARKYQNIYGGTAVSDGLAGLEPLVRNGSFGVLRLIEQHEDAFDRAKAAVATAMGIGADDPLTTGFLLGRLPDGEPMALRHDPAKPGVRNDFDYAPSWEHRDAPEDHDGSRCPVHAHIRRTNPRSARVAGRRHTHRLLRRGLPTDWTEADGSHHVGLMGLFLCADLERQFEFIQRQWVQGGGRLETQDPLVGVREQAMTFRAAPGVDVTIPPLVTTRGCLYLFYPGLGALRQLASLNVAPPPAPSVGGGLSLPPLPTGVVEKLVEWVVKHVIEADWFGQWVKRHFGTPAPQRPPQPQPQLLGVTSADFMADPCKHYRPLRQAGQRVLWVDEHEAYWVLTRPEVARLFNEPENFVQARPSSGLRGIITADGDQHRRIRSAFEAALCTAGRPVNTLVAQAVDEALSQVRGMPQFDFMQAFGRAVPMAVFWKMFGLPEQAEACNALATTIMTSFSRPTSRAGGAKLGSLNAEARLLERLAVALAEAIVRGALPWGGSRFEGTLLGEVAARTKVVDIPGLPVLTEGRTLEFSEAVVSLLQFVLAGSLSLQFVLGSATRNFLIHRVEGRSVWATLAGLQHTAPEQFRALLRTALDESRRVDPGVTIVQRYTAHEVTLAGVTLPADCAVFAVVASANRDGPDSERLEEFDWQRAPQPGVTPFHFSLGDGIHHCIGADLQGLILPEVLARLMREPGFDKLRLVDEESTPAWLDNVYFRGLLSLPVTLCQ